MNIDWIGNPEATHFDPVDQNFLREVGSALLLFNKNKGWTVPVHTSYGFTIEDCHRLLIKRPEWDGEGLPPAGTVCEVLWNEARMEYLRTKVFGVDERGQAIHRFDEGPKKFEYQADVLVTSLGKKVFRPIRTAEQIAAEERLKAIDEMAAVYKTNYEGHVKDGCKALYDAGYRKQEVAQ